jgi:hypothetical protein
MKYSEDLKHTLRCYPEIKTVWFNEQGVWAFHAREGFDIVVPAEDIINEKETDEDDINNNQNQSPYASMTVAKLKEEMQARNIEIPASYIKADLIKLLDEDDINNNQNSQQ